MPGQAFLSLAFAIEGFLMLSHRKHEALDQVVHALLAATMLACSAFAAAELAAPHSLLLTAGRALACLLQGMWLIQARPTTLMQCVSSMASLHTRLSALPTQ